MKGVIIAGGEGKRLKPLTHTKPKCMIPVAGKPILTHVIEALKDAGVKDLVIVVNYLKDRIIDEFGDGRNFGVRIRYAQQKKMRGTADAFLAAEGMVDGPFVGIASDIITEGSAIKKLIRLHDSEMTVGLKRVDDVSEYGTAEVEKGRIVKFEEKPKVRRSGLVNCSMYVMEDTVFSKLRSIEPSKRREYEVTDLIRMLAKKKGVRGVELKEFWRDLGMPWELFDANEFLLNRMPERREGELEDCKVKGKVIIEKGARVFNSFVEGPVFIGKNTEIGPYSFLRGNTSIGDNCGIGDSTTVKNSIIMNGVNAKHLSYIGDSIVGENCNFGAGTQIANWRFDAGTIKMEVLKKEVDTKRSKLGVVIGDNTKTGVLASVMPGKTIGDNCWIGANVQIDRDIPRATEVFLKQELLIRKQR
ncbi:MAG: N-acetylglucosamine-1-phosphate uridyltransferase / Glucosamine-1-phosphate N-acetyltransferase [Candidatus Fermentimicrarchaeum limneticum]|uniref:N-acetylglucosamine-1-phosphate uridyltransferase / Glucosamine-1-phosphate N-acetyltransferase n=1 Tax=Fermentimicrarchaeum limneticum TaxID=2795018 RepID=A0A7D5XJ87_FERL1|nr:MAG: N-acetylglucosamine-1-phosphate uridyltransferase / Glucosamine-1-phosphate N-acetyltransferase [Candidatus Fermentimicrarchaeum limneticum]